MIRRALLDTIEHWQANPHRPRGRCVFEPTCSRYAHEAISSRGLLIGLVLTAWRVLRCNPISSGGHDPVPPRSKSRREQGAT